MEIKKGLHQKKTHFFLIENCGMYLAGFRLQKSGIEVGFTPLKEDAFIYHCILFAYATIALLNLFKQIRSYPLILADSGQACSLHVKIVQSCIELEYDRKEAFIYPYIRLHQRFVQWCKNFSTHRY